MTQATATEGKVAVKRLGDRLQELEKLAADGDNLVRGIRDLMNLPNEPIVDGPAADTIPSRVIDIQRVMQRSNSALREVLEAL